MRLNLERRSFSIGKLMKMYKDGKLQINSSHYVHDDFIDSIAVGLPFGHIYLKYLLNGKYEVIDGCGRLNTIFDFLDGKTDFKYFTLSEFKPEDHTKVVNIIMNTTVETVIVNMPIDDSAIETLLGRINS